MKKYILLTLGLLATTLLPAQILDPVDYSHQVKSISDSEVELQVTATMDEGWHIYSVNTSPESMIIGTELNLTDSSTHCILGSVQEPVPHTAYDPNFQEELSSHEGTVTFTQRIKVLSREDFIVKAEFIYQTCDASKCLPPEYIDLEFEVKALPPSTPVPSCDETTGSTTPTNETDKEASAKDVAPGVDPEKPDIDYAAGEKYQDSMQSEEEAQASQETASVETTPDDDKAKRSLITIFILSFLGGFAALLTPCVFPMIPLTVSFFTKQSKNRAKGVANAMVYGLAIIILYTAIGLIITKAFGSDALNALSTNPWMNIFFFLLLVIFAISFFGAFEITLPSSWVNRSDRAADKGGIVGIFFMAFTLALVSFSCTGPIIGTLLVEAASGGYQGPLIGMFGFSLALALPFTLFAMFPGWLNSLPQSGGWLNSVKVVLGFIELAFAFKFLSTADLVWQAGLLKRKWFIAIWIAIFILLTLYLLGTYKMPHDSPGEKISVPRLIFSVLTLSFVIYLMPGLWGAPLKLISGFPPPQFYSESPGGFGARTIPANQMGDIPDGADPEHCPHELPCFHEFDKGLAYARKSDKPIMLDFTGWGCVNCRKMEEQVWSDPRVLDLLRDDFVLISLYVDEREKLPKDEQYVSEITGKKINTVGNKWSDFQIEHYQSNSQPQYVIIGHENLKPLIETTAYDPDIEAYIDWLKRGISKFEAQNP
ncbi:MAG: cytochrome c biogenesis protein CcdA [Owenweeksia sp.]|nr:cytochrome c biogenesis protein CcdA [Owenweeksia sp.]